MDVLKIKSNLVRNVITKMITKIIQKKYGYKVDIQLNDLDIKIVDGEAHLHADVDLEIDNEEFMKIMKTIVSAD